MKYTKSVIVLLSVYNGERYLTEQIESILSQEGVKIHLVIRDDGSKDDSVNIIREYMNLYNNITLLVDRNVGCIRSFLLLLKYAVDNFSDSSYYAFADQDDVWYSDKLSKAISLISKEDESNGVVYHSCYEVVDEKLNIITTTNADALNTLGESMISNVSIGCSMVFDYKVLSRSSRIVDKAWDDKFIPYHDVWVYLIALASNSAVIFDNDKTFKYRQHGHNVIGIGNKFDILKLRIKNIFKYKKLKSHYAHLLMTVLTEQEMGGNKNMLKLAANYHSEFKLRLALAFHPEYKTKEISINLVYKVIVLLGLY